MSKDTSFGNELIAALEEAVAHAEGKSEKATFRTYVPTVAAAEAPLSEPQRS